MFVSWKWNKEESVVTSPCTNVAIAAYTTAQARLTLSEYLYKLDKCVLYYDTDSVIFLNSPNDVYELPRGLYSGNLQTSWRITALVRLSKHSFQPKCYAYRVRTPQETTHDTCKIKEIRINYENLE